MRWEALFGDLEAQLEAADQVEFAGEVADRSRREVARLGLVDRLSVAADAELTLGLGPAGAVRGRVAATGPDWVLVTEGGRADALVPLSAISWVVGLAALAGDPASVGTVESRLDLAYALRGVARDRSPVALVLRDGTTVSGTIDRVGADFVDVAEHPPGEPRRPRAVLAARTVPFGGLAVVRPA